MMARSNNNKRFTTFGARRDKLAGLLKLGSFKEDPSQARCHNKRIGECLHDYLQNPLPLDESWRDRLPAALVDLCPTTTMLSGGTIAALLQNPQTDHVLMETLKGYMKNLSQQAESRADHDAATILYFGAIAHALVYSGLCLSQYSFEELKERFQMLSESEWITAELRTLFERATRECSKRICP